MSQKYIRRYVLGVYVCHTKQVVLSFGIPASCARHSYHDTTQMTALHIYTGSLSTLAVRTTILQLQAVGQRLQGLVTHCCSSDSKYMRAICTGMSPVLPFWTKYRLSHPEKKVFSLYKKLSCIKVAIFFLNFESRSTVCRHPATE